MFRANNMSHREHDVSEDDTTSLTVNIAEVAQSFCNFVPTKSFVMADGFASGGTFNLYRKRQASIKKITRKLAPIPPVEATVVDDNSSLLPDDFLKITPVSTTPDSEKFENIPKQNNNSSDSDFVETHSDTMSIGQEASNMNTGTTMSGFSHEKYMALECDVADLKQKVTNLMEIINKKNEENSSAQYAVKLLKQTSPPIPPRRRCSDQLSDRISTFSKDNNNTPCNSFPSKKIEARHPPPPPPPPPPPTPSGFRYIAKGQGEKSDLVNQKMRNVLQEILDGGKKLKPIRQSSPKLPLPKHINSGNGIIAELLKRKFENAPFDSPSSNPDENSFGQSFTSDDDDGLNIYKQKACKYSTPQ